MPPTARGAAPPPAPPPRGLHWYLLFDRDADSFLSAVRAAHPAYACASWPRSSPGEDEPAAWKLLANGHLPPDAPSYEVFLASGDLAASAPGGLSPDRLVDLDPSHPDLISLGRYYFDELELLPDDDAWRHRQDVYGPDQAALAASSAYLTTSEQQRIEEALGDIGDLLDPPGSPDPLDAQLDPDEVYLHTDTDS